MFWVGHICQFCTSSLSPGKKNNLNNYFFHGSGLRSEWIFHFLGLWVINYFFLGLGMNFPFWRESVGLIVRAWEWISENHFSKCPNLLTDFENFQFSTLALCRELSYHQNSDRNYLFVKFISYANVTRQTTSHSFRGTASICNGSSTLLRLSITQIHK